MADLAIKKKRKRIRWAPYLFSAPFFATYLVFTLFAMIFTFYIGLTDWNGFGAMNYIGFDNYLRMFDFATDPRLLQTLVNTFVLMMMSMPVGIGIAVFLCYFIQKKTLKKQHAFRVLYYLPALMTPVAIGLLWSILFDYENGTINKILMFLGIITQNIYWLGTEAGSRFVLSFLLVWASFGSTVLFLSSALTNVPDEVIEAAYIDGAGPVRTYVSISLPVIRDVIVFIVITGMIGGFQLYDAPVLLFSSGPSGGLPYGGPNRACLTMMMLIYDEAFNGMHYGYGAALSYGMFLFVAAFSFTSMKLMTKKE